MELSQSQIHQYNQELLSQLSTNLFNAERTFGIFSPQYAAVLGSVHELLQEISANVNSNANGSMDPDGVLSRAMGGLELKGAAAEREGKAG